MDLYINKRNLQEKGFTDPDNGDGYNDDDLISVSDDELELLKRDEIEMDEKMKTMALSRKNFEGFDIDPGNDYITDQLQQEIFDVGMFGKARGKVYNIDQFDEEDFIKINRNRDKTKILMVHNKDSFDDFTEKYGYINKKDRQIYIKWDQVYKNYKGIYITSSVLDDREDTIPYKGKTVQNWVDYDFNRLDDVIIFRKYRTLIHKKEVVKPFKGYAVDSYSIDNSEFTSISDTVTNDKILIINDIKSFDKFTKKYGVVTPSKEMSFISIKWNNVSDDYDGIIIEEDKFFKKNRYSKAFLNDKLHNSWWEKSGIASNVVYLFA